MQRDSRGQSKLAAEPVIGGDELGAYSHEELWRMNERFCAAVERAIARGLEWPERNGYSTRRDPPAPACDTALADTDCCT